MCARDIVCVELYSHIQPRATSHKYIVCVLSQNQNQKQRKPPPYFDAGGGEGGVTEEEWLRTRTLNKIEKIRI